MKKLIFILLLCLTSLARADEFDEIIKQLDDDTYSVRAIARVRLEASMNVENFKRLKEVKPADAEVKKIVNEVIKHYYQICSHDIDNPIPRIQEMPLDLQDQNPKLCEEYYEKAVVIYNQHLPKKHRPVDGKGYWNDSWAHDDISRSATLLYIHDRLDEGMTQDQAIELLDLFAMNAYTQKDMYLQDLVEQWQAFITEKVRKFLK